MAIAVHCEVRPEQFSLARRASEYVRAFYPDISVTLDRDAARLASDERSADALRLIWKTTLGNERLLVQGAARRAAVLESLVR
jgi:hypothetical protein